MNKTRIISDTHIGARNEEPQDFKYFLEKTEKVADCLILAGDIFEFWTRTMIDVLVEYRNIFNKLENLNCEVKYAVGNHDYYMINFRNEFDFKIKKTVSTTAGDEKIIVKHGHKYDWKCKHDSINEKLCYSTDMMGKIYNTVWDKSVGSALQRNNKIIKNAIRKKPDSETLIFGHTHRPYVNNLMKIYNCGSFLPDDDVKTYIEISDNDVKLERFPNVK